MEFFRFIKSPNTIKSVQEFTTLDNLSTLSNEIFLIGDQNEGMAEIGGIWGEFTLTRHEINGGVRFALVECPNALTWTITTGQPPEPEAVVIHFTINRKQKDSEFIEDIQDFLDDHVNCLHQEMAKQ